MMSSFAGITRSLKHRNYRLFFSGQTVSLIGTWLTRVASSWLAYRLSHSATVLGIVSFAGLIPTFLIAPFAGVLADRWNKHRTLIITQICAALQSAALAALTISGRMTIPWLVGLSAVQGLINAFDMPVRQAFVVEMIEDRRDLPNAIALNSSMVNLARLVGPALAGILIAAVGEGGCFAIDAVSYLAVIATLLMMSFKQRPHAPAERKHLLLELKDGFAYAGRSPAIVSVLALLALVSFMGVPYMTLLPMIVSERLGGGARMLGYLTGASGLGALTGALFLASRRSVQGLGRIVLLAALTFGVGLIAFGMSRSVGISLVLMLVTGMGMMVQMAATNTVLQSIVEENKRGRVMSLFLMAFTGTAPFGSLFGGFMADRIGAALTLEGGGVMCCLGALWFLRALPEIGREIRPAHEEPQLAVSGLVT
ncbi:MAG TPA: MFS transporter [Gemmatimonadaceae bacterium]|jgi:MFS family permease